MSEALVTMFEREQWEKEARRKIICTGCYGVGQRHDRKSDRWEACPTCQGGGRSEAEPHVLRLLEEISRLELLLRPVE